MKKILIALLLGVLTTAMLGQAPSGKSSTAPTLTAQQKVDLMKLQLKFANISQQLRSLQDQGKALQDEYAKYVTGLCSSTDGKNYQVAFDDEPSCKEVPAPAKK